MWKRNRNKIKFCITQSEITSFYIIIRIARIRCIFTFLSRIGSLEWNFMSSAFYWYDWVALATRYRIFLPQWVRSPLLWHCCEICALLSTNLAILLYIPFFIVQCYHGIEKKIAYRVRCNAFRKSYREFLLIRCAGNFHLVTINHSRLNAKTLLLHLPYIYIRLLISVRFLFCKVFNAIFHVTFIIIIHVRIYPKQLYFQKFSYNALKG